MKKTFLSAVAALAFAVTPALAGSTTVEFVNTDGETTVVEFNEDGTALLNGEGPVAYTMDEATKTICGQTPDGETCVTFDEMGEGVGFTTGYSNDQGDTGTATITAVNE